MELQVAAHLPGRIGESAAALQQYRRRHASRREHHDLRIDAEAVRHLAGERAHDHPLDTGRAPAPPGEEALDAGRGQHSRARMDRGRNIGDVGGLLGACAAPGEALAAAAAADDAAGDRLVRPAERSTAFAEEKIARPLHLVGRRRDAEEILDGLVVRVQVGASGPPELVVLGPGGKRRLGRAHANRRIDQRTATERVGLHGRHDEASRRAQAPFAHRASHRDRTVDDEVLRRERRALLDQHDVLARGRKPMRHHRTARPRADHHGVAGVEDVAGVVGEHPHRPAHRIAPAAGSSKRCAATGAAIGATGPGGVTSSRR